LQKKKKTVLHPLQSCGNESYFTVISPNNTRWLLRERREERGERRRKNK
jgi:hypothetical protein